MPDCILSDWRPSAKGYAYRTGRGYAHRLAYETSRGPIPPGLELDHICNVRICINPDHMEAVTHAENMRRAQMRRPTCGRGHSWDWGNQYINPATGRRECRACGAARGRRRRAQ